MKFIKELKKRGYIKLKNFFSKSALKKIQKDFFYLSEKLYQKHYDPNCKKNFNKDGFDSYCVESFIKNNTFNSKFYEVCKKLNSFHELFYKKKVTNIIEKIFNKKRYGILNRGYGFRFDYPSDKTFLTQCHLKSICLWVVVLLRVHGQKKFYKQTGWKPKVKFEESVKKLLQHCRENI